MLINSSILNSLSPYISHAGIKIIIEYYLQHTQHEQQYEERSKQ